MGSKKTKTTSNTQTVSTPTNPAWVTDYGQQFGSQVNGLLTADPTKYVAPASTLQNQAFQGASTLGSTWQDSLASATGAVKGLLTPTANTSLLPTAPSVSTYGAAAGPVATARTAGQAGVAGYDANGYTAAPQAAVSGYGANGYDAFTLGKGAQIAPTTDANATLVKSLLSGTSLGGYENPYTDSVVNSTLADFDQKAGTDLANAKAYQAQNGATGGSGNALFTSNLVDNSNRARATTESGLRSDAYNAAAALATTDAGNLTNVSEFNAGQSNARAQAQAQLDQATLTGDQDAINSARSKLADAQNAEAAQETQARNTSALDYVGRSDTAGGLLATARNAEAAQQAGAYDTSALDFAGRSDVNSRANADSRNTATQSLLGRTDAASQFGATANNAEQNLLFTSGLSNNQFNAGQQDSAVTRALAAAGLLGNLGQEGDALATNDVTTQGTLGGVQRGIDADQRTAQLTLMQLIQQLGGYSPTLFQGKTGSIDTTTTVKDTPSILDQIGQGLDLAAQGISLGTGVAAKFNNLNPMSLVKGLGAGG